MRQLFEVRMPVLRFLLLAIPLIELAGLIILGQAIGVGLTLLWVLVSGILGVAVIQSQGWNMLQRLQARMAQDSSPFGVLKSGMWGVLAGLLLVFPGVLSDAAALICLLLAWRYRGQPQPGDPDGPGVWRQGDHDVIEGEWEQGREERLKRENPADKE
ncbi:FxsA family protein [uncultured Halopseudomonas sp.]|uniref:FxsA family protein n=1 Tax=uncultured Halopseudomonas sp. TaxID=2901193 RepID=UPI0030ED4EA1|tara:strand:- start:6377 stop:6850 length:474 start_codon:yes stop_codon:yes gene_type:complete